MDNIAALERKLNATFKAIAKQLEHKAIAALWRMTRTHPKKRVVFCSAMGSYTWSIRTPGTYEQKYITPPVWQVFNRIENDYGWNAIPAPVKVTIENGKLTKLTDW